MKNIIHIITIISTCLLGSSLCNATTYADSVCKQVYYQVRAEWTDGANRFGVLGASISSTTGEISTWITSLQGIVPQIDATVASFYWDDDLGRWNMADDDGYHFWVQSQLDKIGAEPTDDINSIHLKEKCNPCEEEGTTYSLVISATDVQDQYTGLICVEDCQQTQSVTMAYGTEFSTGTQWATTVKYEPTGVQCSDGVPVDNDPTPPDSCQEEINSKALACGGTMKIQSWDYATCTGECVPDECQDKWNELVTRCGSFMQVGTWNKDTCEGTCLDDPLPPSEPGPTDLPVEKVDNTERVNLDGTSEVDRTVTRSDGKGGTITEKTTIYYDSNGNQTGTSSETNHSGDGEDGGTGTALEGILGPGPAAPSLEGEGEGSEPGSYNDLDWSPVTDAFTAFADKLPITDIVGRFSIFGHGTTHAPVWTWPGFHVSVLGIPFSMPDIEFDFSYVDPIAKVIRWGIGLLMLVIAFRWVFKVYGGA